MRLFCEWRAGEIGYQIQIDETDYPVLLATGPGLQIRTMRIAIGDLAAKQWLQWSDVERTEHAESLLRHWRRGLPHRRS